MLNYVQECTHSKFVIAAHARRRARPARRHEKDRIVDESGLLFDRLWSFGEGGSRQHKLIYNALWQIPYEPVDFASTDFWKDLRERNAAGRLSPELSRMYFSSTRPMYELYDLANDPGESDNLAGRTEAAVIEQKLRTALIEWMVVERDYLPLPIASDPPDMR